MPRRSHSRQLSPRHGRSRPPTLFLSPSVGSFSMKENAEGLMQSLKDRGYRPMMSRSSDPRGRVWYVVKLGPYNCWNAASRVAARVSIAENLRPVIGPVQ
jgi:hypothetical protein